MAEYCLRCCTCCLSEEERNAIAIDHEIKRIFAEQKKRERREIKVLLLGTGESGKTTFMKQMRIIHGHNFSEDERRGYTKLVFENIVTAMRAMTQAMSTLKIPYVNPQNECLDVHDIIQLQRGYVEAIRQLWDDHGFKIFHKRRRKYQLLDSTAYFIKNLERIAAEGYIPTDQDILQVYFPTNGFTEHCFTLEKFILRLVDVGGVKSQRRRWIHCFENVTSLIFFASLSEYDQVLVENNKENRMKESLSLFYTTIHSPWFGNSSIILFLNKMDILEEKIQTSDIQTYFPDFKGKCRDSQDARKYISEIYNQQAIHVEKKECKHIYSHFTCATDTNNIRMVFNDVKDTVLIKSKQEFGVL